jgi:glycosyltransferase involved in cell wall biosynthesis
MSMRLSVIIPCYNEEGTIDRVLDRLAELATTLKPQIDMELVAVDDASRDDTWRRLRQKAASLPDGMLHIARHDVNRGKGAALRTGRDHVSGDIVVIQDADLEYDPDDIPDLIAPIVDGRADAVIGTRFGGAGEHRVLYFWHRVANGMLTLLSNMLTDVNLTDMESGYKAFTRDAFRLMHLTNDRFGIEPEIVARLSQMRARIYEIPISYHGRTYEEGKKITWRDGLAALGHILRARATSGRQPRLEPRPAPVRLPRPTPPRLIAVDGFTGQTIVPARGDRPLHASQGSAHPSA